MSSIDTIIILFLGTGFTVGFGHCVGMCGPIVVSLSLALEKRGIAAPQMLYHAGRISTYTFLGGIVGLTGSFTRVTAAMAGLQKGVLIFSGIDRSNCVRTRSRRAKTWVFYRVIFAKRWTPICVRFTMP